jgi:magnesium transporter
MNAVVRELGESLLPYVHRDFFKLRQDLTVEQALDIVRKEAPSDGILYFYVVDDSDRLVGVLPTRRLLTADGSARLSGLAVTSVVAITQQATVADACQMFLKHKYLAFPVVDGDLRLVGMIDISLFAEEIVDFTERRKADDVFELLGFRVSQLKKASAFQVWRYRFPWLLTTIASGAICALLAAAFEKTLSRAIVLAFFLTLVLALGESVSIQAMTLTTQRLRFVHPTFRWFLKTLGQDVGPILLLALSCGLIVGAIVVLLNGLGPACFVIGGSITLSLIIASVLGLLVPSVLHGLKLDPKVAAGPVTLAIADTCTILIYLLFGSLLR